MQLEGVVASGHGAGAKDVSEGLYGEGFYAGTLNVRLHDPTQLDALPKPSRVVEYFGIERRLWQGRVDEQEVTVMHPRPQRPTETWLTDSSNVELLARVKLRDALGLQDGDDVTVEIIT